MARARNAQHRSKAADGDEGCKVPRISMDYFFMSEIDRMASENPMLVMVNEATGEKFARATGRKGLGESGSMDWLMKDMVEQHNGWGHQGGVNGKVVLKCDGEPSIKTVRGAVASLLGGVVIPENIPKGESACNGAAEEAGKTVREFVRVFKEQLEELAKMKVQPDDVVVLWMVRWAAINCSRFLVGKDGKTGYERRTGRKCKTPVAMFGETVWYKELRDNKHRGDNFNTEWKEGIWLGHSHNSNETIIGTTDGAIRAFAIQRQPEADRWDADRIRNIKGTPQKPNPSKLGIEIPIKIRFEPTPVVSNPPVVLLRREVAPRKMKITQRLIDKYGMTEGCQGCAYKGSGLDDHRGHSQRCRERIEKAIAEDEEEKRVKERQDEKVNQWLAEQLEKQDKRGRA